MMDRLFELEKKRGTKWCVGGLLLLLEEKGKKRKKKNEEESEKERGREREECDKLRELWHRQREKKRSDQF